MELGVTTQSGIVFTGATAERGEVEIEAWFGDGPTIERTIIEPVSDELFTAETDIVLPSVPISFDEPRDGESLQLMGRKDGARWSTSARVKTDHRVFGLLLEFPRASRTPRRVGAGVLAASPSTDTRRRPRGRQGPARAERLDQALPRRGGPDRLWRLVAHRRDHLRKSPSSTARTSSDRAPRA